MNKRSATITRTTKETDITVSINLDGNGKSDISTGIPFIDHMLELFAKHGFFDLEVKAVGDIEIDYHHTIEDLGLTLGEAISKSLGNKAGIRRYGSCLLPMDETLAQVALDLSGRPFLVYDLVPPVDRIKDIDTALFHEFFQALAVKTGMNLHITLEKGREIHHVFEAVFKALAKALDMAVTIDPRVKGVLSTKGSL
ncbi:MAG: imidazoleglycerol-phosphate dehydratase HisB [Victivallaceae bacterium]|nr:imidazoleglycerol-phosphate dehydratase HisB [Victivallaceae bacterium]